MRPDDSRTRAAQRTRVGVFGRRCAGAALPLAVLVAAVALAATGGWSPRRITLRAASSSGSISIADSREGAAVLTTGSMKPGDSVQGTVTITNAGTPASVRLGKSHLADQLGAYGGALSSRLELVVVDLAHPGAPVYSGPLSSLGGIALGGFAKGEARVYRFTATLPNAGPPPSATTGDNAYQGSQSTVEFDWTATGPGVTPPVRPVLTVSAASTQRFGGGVSLRATCTLACKVHLSGSISIAGSRQHYALAATDVQLAAKRAKTVTLQFSKAARAAIAKALGNHKRVTATVRAALPGGAPRQLTVTITKR